MVDTEIWLRLMSISSLYGDDMVRIAHWLAKQSHIDAVVLQQTGLTLRQAQRFLSFPRKSIESSLCWLEQPNHHLILRTANFILLNFWRRQITPAHCLLKENCTRCIHFSLP